jgi:hypothetical protein
MKATLKVKGEIFLEMTYVIYSVTGNEELLKESTRSASKNCTTAAATV